MEQMGKFRRQATRQLTHMAMQAGTRAGERNGVALMRGRPAEPGTGLPLWTRKQVEEHVLMQLQPTPDWIGERFAIGTEDDSEIRLAYAIRPDRAEEEESVERQPGTGKQQRSW